MGGTTAVAVTVAGLVAALVAVAAGPGEAWGLTAYRCKDENGNAVFSDHPCGRDATEVQVKVPRAAAPQPAPATATPVAGAERAAGADAENEQPEEDPVQAMKAQAARVDREVERNQTRREIERLELRVKNYLSFQEEALAGLRRQQGRANDNLAGAVYRQSLAQDMEVVTAEWAGKIRQVQGEIDVLRAKLATLQGP